MMPPPVAVLGPMCKPEQLDEEGLRAERYQRHASRIPLLASRKRQVVLGGRYIVDFFAPSVGLVEEVDGSVHCTSRTADRRRAEALRRLGYRVVHVEAALVLHDVESALAVVRRAITG